MISRPRDIHPSCVEVGDVITVTQRERKGITATNTARVGEIQTQGQSHFYFTDEHAIIFSTQYGVPLPKIVVHRREPEPQTTLFEMSL